MSKSLSTIMTTEKFAVIFKIYLCVIFLLLKAVNICVLTMGGRWLRWLWLSGSPQLIFLERLKDGNIHVCFFSRSGYRRFINPPPSLENLLLDITLRSISFRCRFVFFC